MADGLGGYAMGTVAGLRRRRYHALQVVAGAEAGLRHVGLVALDVVVALATSTSGWPPTPGPVASSIPSATSSWSAST